MLDSETKRRIDTARDILVGKVPDPKSQVEQITIALIYKFMDDMDAESEELGGERKFFAGEFAKYGWAKLMRSGLGGHEMLGLYGETITRMPENPGIPPLFRDIFKNAYLPYRDPETLRAFLKVIDDFTYDHSERLGDAFEYLLAVLGSQGDAGQFRTPRHIIDFIISIVDPKKDETVLDPACGTAGFLISSYKHILAANRDADGNSILTPDERTRLAGNFKGYDISPDMVRLSLVNMYLHGFTDPHIYEYDTLTSQDRWNEYADVILANPPFMSPKGGIKPHNRFSVQSKRSEVLFVDYMAEHLTPEGRAGIIVPEGVVFQSQTAYRQLRRMLVENYLVAVVSLPAGVFNPYSGVKTSILILDRRLARVAKTVAFFKIEHDGFGLGAQRRPIEKNDLPQARDEIATYLGLLRAGQSVDGFEPTAGLVATKEQITASGDYGLNGERYRQSRFLSQAFPHIEVGELCKPEYGYTASADEQGDARFVRITDIASDGRIREEGQKFITLTEDSRSYLLCEGDILVARTGATFGKTALFRESYSAVFASYLIRLRFPPDKLLPEFYLSFTQSREYWDQARRLSSGGGQPQFNGNAIARIRVPLPPLEVQREIVAEIEVYQKVIDGARAVIENYHPQVLIDPEWPMVELEDLFDITSSKRVFQSEWRHTGVPFYRAREIVALAKQGYVQNELYISEEMYAEYSEKYGAPQPEDMMVTGVGTLGVCYVVAEGDRFYFKDGNIIWLKKKTDNLTDFVHLMFLSEGVKRHIAQTAGATVGTFTIGTAKKTKVPLPPLATQRELVAEIAAEKALVDACRELIVRMEGKIQMVLDRVWGDGEPVTSAVREPFVSGLGQQTSSGADGVLAS
jgi:type I restriction enzyme M protein